MLANVSLGQEQGILQRPESEKHFKIYLKCAVSYIFNFSEHGSTVSCAIGIYKNHHKSRNQENLSITCVFIV